MQWPQCAINRREQVPQSLRLFDLVDLRARYASVTIEEGSLLLMGVSLILIKSVVWHIS